MWDYTIKAEVVTGRFSRQVETFVVSAKNLTDAMIQIEKNVKIGRVIHSTCAKNKGNEIMVLTHKTVQRQTDQARLSNNTSVSVLYGSSVFVTYENGKIVNSGSRSTN